LHRFEDQVQSAEGRKKPVPARKLDENFKVVRLKVSKAAGKLLKVQENFPQSDELTLTFEIPAKGHYVLGFVDGQVYLWETAKCNGSGS
jgi:hypothetical protein